MSSSLSRSRIYVCHTFYHVYITVLKELALPKSEQGNATLVLSLMSNNFKGLGERAAKSGLFEKVYEFDEKRPEFFPELERWKKNRGNIISNSLARIIYTRKFARLQEKYIPVDFKKYKEVYVFCDSDPIGIYLSQHHIKYHAIEDGLNYLKPYAPLVPAVIDNRGAFGFKRFLSDKLNLIFIQDGFNKYCIDMEVNDLSVIAVPCKKYKEVPRQALTDRLTDSDKQLIINIFVSNLPRLRQQLSEIDSTKQNIIILTEPLCKDLSMRKKLFTDLLNQFSKEGNVFFKPHPRDELDYPAEFPSVPQFDASLPMEILNFYTEVHFKKVVSIYTQIDAIKFADEKVVLGSKFMDKYEDPDVHKNVNM